MYAIFWQREEPPALEEWLQQRPLAAFNTATAAARTTAAFHSEPTASRSYSSPCEDYRHLGNIAGIAAGHAHCPTPSDRILLVIDDGVLFPRFGGF